MASDEADIFNQAKSAASRLEVKPAAKTPQNVRKIINDAFERFIDFLKSSRNDTPTDYMYNRSLFRWMIQITESCRSCFNSKWLQSKAKDIEGRRTFHDTNNEILFWRGIESDLVLHVAWREWYELCQTLPKAKAPSRGEKVDELEDAQHAAMMGQLCQKTLNLAKAPFFQSFVPQSYINPLEREMRPAR